VCQIFFLSSYPKRERIDHLTALACRFLKRKEKKERKKEKKERKKERKKEKKKTAGGT